MYIYFKYVLDNTSNIIEYSMIEEIFTLIISFITTKLIINYFV